jgi:hypothetical protein
VEIGLDDALHVRLGFRRRELANPAAPFGGFPGVQARKVIKATASMGLDIAERGLLRAKVQQSARQDNVLEDIGEIAGMKFVMVIHSAASRAVSFEKSEHFLRRTGAQFA